MPRSGSGTYTLPSGNPVVTGTTIESNWANTTLSDIATTLTDSLSRSGQGGMTAALRVADGTQGAPGVGFANETSSGFYRAGTGEVWAVVQGAQTLNLDASGVYVPADKTTTVDGAFVFNEAGADKDARFEGDTDANLLFVDASTDRVGVGTNTPDAKLTVNGVAAVGDGAVGAPSIANTGDLNTGIWFPAADTVAVSTGGVEAARFDSSGNLGIGTSSPAQKLHVYGGNLQISNAAGSTTYIGPADGLITSGSNTATAIRFENGYLGFAYSTTELLRLTASGNLGLGVTPSASWTGGGVLQQGIGALYTNGALGAHDLTYNSVRTGSNTYVYAQSSLQATRFQQRDGAFNFFTAGTGTAGNAISFTQSMTLDASGNLSIGTTTTPTQITFAGTSGITYQRSTDNTFAGVLDYLKSRGSAASPTAVQDNDDLFQLRVAPFHGSAYTYLNSQVVQVDGTFTSGQNPPTRIAWYTNVANGSSTERARITSGGDLLVGTTSYLVSSNEKASFDCGSTNGLTTKTSGGAASWNYFAWNSATSGNNGFIEFGTEGTYTARGSITYNRAGGLVAYNTTSDYRAKDIIGPVQNPGATIDALKVYEGVMKGATQSRPMLIAHEAQEHAPYAVSGVKDEVNEDGTPKFQQMDVSSLVPLLLAEIQSLRARVAALEAL